MVNDNQIDYIKSVVISISINLISSVIIIYLIDFKLEDDKQAEVYEKRKIIYRQLLLPLKQFDNLVLNMYKSTVTYDEMKKLCYDVENIDSIIEKLILINNEKYSYLYSCELKRSELWKETIIIHSLNFIINIENFYKNNSSDLTNSLNNECVNILSANVNRYISERIFEVPITTEDLLKILNFKKLLKSSFFIKNELLKYYDKNEIEVDIDKFLNDNIKPRFKSGINYEE